MRDLRTGQVGRTPPRLHRCAGLSHIPLLAVCRAGAGDVLMARLREGRANTARGAAHFVCVKRWPGSLRRMARGQLTVRADSGFERCIAWYPSAARWMSASPSPSGTKACTMSSRPYLKMPGRRFPTGWTAPPMWQRPPISPSRVSRDAGQPVRLIVRRVKPTPGSQLALFATYSYHGFITDRDGEMLELEADHRRHAEIEKCDTRPQGRKSDLNMSSGSQRRQPSLAVHGDGATTWPAMRARQLALGLQIYPRRRLRRSSPVLTLGVRTGDTRGATSSSRLVRHLEGLPRRIFSRFEKLRRTLASAAILFALLY